MVYKNNYTITKQIQSNLQGIVINMLSRVHGPVPRFGNGREYFHRGI